MQEGRQHWCKPIRRPASSWTFSLNPSEQASGKTTLDSTMACCHPLAGDLQLNSPSNTASACNECLLGCAGAGHHPAAPSRRSEPLEPGFWIPMYATHCPYYGQRSVDLLPPSPLPTTPKHKHTKPALPAGCCTRVGMAAPLAGPAGPDSARTRCPRLWKAFKAHSSPAHPTHRLQPRMGLARNGSS